MTHGDNGSFGSPEHIAARKILVFGHVGMWLSARNISDRKGRILADVGKRVAGGRPFAGLDPSIAFQLGEQFTERQFGSERSVGDFGVHSFDEGGEDTTFEVAAGGGQQSVVGMPVDLHDGGFVLLNVLGHPPVVIFFEVTHGNAFGSISNSEFVFFGTPFDVSCGSVDTQNYQNGFPLVVLQGPHVSVTILRARDDTVGFGSPIDAGNNLIVLSELVFQGEVVSALGVNVDFVVVGANGHLCAVGVPGVASNARS